MNNNRDPSHLLLRSGEWQAAASGLRAVLDADPADAASHAGLTIASHRLLQLQDAEAYGWRALVLDRETVSHWTNLALSLRATRGADAAEPLARAAAARFRGSADPHYALGVISHDRNDLAAATEHFRIAIALRADFAEAWLNLGLVRQKGGDLAEAEACYRTAITFGASVTQVGGNLGLALLEQGRVTDAELACRAALAEQPENASTRVNLAMALLLQGRMVEGWSAYEARLPLQTIALPPNAGTRLMSIDAASKQSVLVQAEQGFGDILQFCRYAPLLTARGASVVLRVPTALQRLLSTLSNDLTVIADDQPPPSTDFHCWLMSLPFLFGTTLDKIPAETPYTSRPNP